MQRDPIASEPLSRRARREWALLGGVVLLLAALLAGSLADDRRRLLADARQRLADQARAVDLNLVRQIEGAHVALVQLREDLASGALVPGEPLLQARLAALAAVMPGVGTMQVSDAGGVLLASSRPDLVGLDTGGREHFRSVRERPEARTLYVSRPFASAAGTYSLNLTVARIAPDGRFDGTVGAMLDPAYFEVALSAVLSTPDTWAGIAHAQGDVLLTVPAQPSASGRNIRQPGSMFAQHLDSGRPHNVLEGPVTVSGDHRVVAHRNVQPPALAMDHALVVAVSRSTAALLAPWRRDALLRGGVLAVLAAAAVPLLLLAQRRRAAQAHEREERARRDALDAERLALALEGGDLGLWDLDLATGAAVVNDRWHTMLGYAPGEGDPSEAGWKAMLHPDDRDAAVSLQDAHVAGRTPAYQSRHRLRHRDGHWLWVLDRGRVVERDADGRALRMVGTHMDISEQVRAEQALRASEQRLATTLDSIGDAVIATDLAGRVVRLNPAGERLTGWSAADAVGRPLAEVFRIVNAGTRRPAADPVAQVLDSGEIVGLANDTLLLARDGRELQIADSAAPIRGSDGRTVGVVLVFSDVTDKYRVVQALRESERQLAMIADALPGPVARVARDGRYRFVNAALLRWFGVQASDVLGMTQRELLGDEAMAFLQPYLERVQAGQAVVFDTDLQTRQGVRDVMVTMLPERDEQGQVCGHFSLATDITARKQSEQALKHSASQLRMAGRVARVGGWRLLLPGPELQLSDEAAALLELPAGTRLDKERALELVPRAQRQALRERVRQALREGSTIELSFDVQTSRGRRHLQALGEPVRDEQGAIGGLQGALQDVTESRRAEQQLRLLEACVAQLNDVVIVTEAAPLDEPGPRIVFVNQAFEQLTGWRAAEVLGRSPRLLQGPATDAAERARIRHALAAGQPVRAELINYTRQREPYWIELGIVPVAVGGAEVTHMVAVQREISARKRSEAELKAARASLAATLDAVPDLLFEVDDDGVILNCHSPSGDLLVLPPERFLGRGFTEVLPAEAAAVVAAALRQARDEGYSRGLQYELTVPAGRRWFELSVSCRAPGAGPDPGGGARYILLARDITERKEAEAERRALEQQLRDLQRIESIGTLAGGIAHDLNNILAAILGNAALAREDLPPEHAAQASLEQINRAGLRARSLVQQILAFSRRQPTEMSVQPLRPLVEETLALLRATLPAGVRLDTELSDEPLAVRGDATQLQQVLMNLCTNAWQAMPEGRGRIVVGVEAVATAAVERRLPPGVCAGTTCVHLWVRDDGSGMDAATRERIFDPFFTTKPVGQGTGLGLPVVHGIVQAHGGAIAVDSAPGAGSTFHVFLPRLQQAATGDGGLPASLPAAAGAGQRVLYVDDDEVMVLMVQRLLQRAGYSVTACTGALQAQRLLAAGAPRFDVVVSDYNMPDMSGLELAQELRRLHPALPVIISSGFLSDELREQAAAAGVRALLKKENTLEELAGLLQQVLAGASTGGG
ncbi:MAG: PAS domain S-box protein [Rubrivivax sp.]|nr:PAS domain S-box protein [Rubrivivax sp.]